MQCINLLCRTVRKYTIPEVTEPLSRLDKISIAVRRVQRTIDNNVSITWSLSKALVNVYVRQIILHSPLTLLQTDLNVLTGFNSRLLQNIPLAQGDIILH